MKNFCESCGKKIDLDAMGHFCDANRYCPKCGDILPKLSSSNYSHRCLEEKIEITKNGVMAALAKSGLQILVYKEGRPGDVYGEFLKELGFK